MNNWPKDLDKNCLITYPHFRGFGYGLEAWLERHPETPLGIAYEFAAKKHGKKGYLDDTSRGIRFVHNAACDVMLNAFHEHIQEGLEDFEEISGKILSGYVTARLEGK